MNSRRRPSYRFLQLPIGQTGLQHLRPVLAFVTRDRQPEEWDEGRWMPDVPGKAAGRAIRAAFERLVLDVPLARPGDPPTSGPSRAVLRLPSVTLLSPQIWGGLVEHPFEVVAVRFDDAGRIRSAALRLMVPPGDGGFRTKARVRRRPKAAEAERAALLLQARAAGYDPVRAGRAIGLCASAGKNEDGFTLAARYLDLAAILDEFLPALRAAVNRAARSVEPVLRTLLDKPHRWRSVPPEFAAELRRRRFPDLADASRRAPGLEEILSLLERARRTGETTARSIRRWRTDWIETGPGFTTDRPRTGTLGHGAWTFDLSPRPPSPPPSTAPATTAAGAPPPPCRAVMESTSLVQFTFLVTAGRATFFEHAPGMREPLPDDAKVFHVATWLRLRAGK